MHSLFDFFLDHFPSNVVGKAMMHSLCNTFQIYLCPFSEKISDAQSAFLILFQSVFFLQVGKTVMHKLFDTLIYFFPSIAQKNDRQFFYTYLVCFSLPVSKTMMHSLFDTFLVCSFLSVGKTVMHSLFQTFFSKFFPSSGKSNDLQFFGYFHSLFFP